MDSSAPTLRLSKGTLQRIEELQSFLGSSSAIALVNGATSEEKQKLIDLSTALFRRAPDEFLKATETHTMARIAYESQKVLERFLNLKDANAFQFEVKEHLDEPERADFTTFHCAIWDRPFIIDTFTEFFRSRHIEYRVILHPMLLHQGRYISLSYIEIDHIQDAAQLGELKTEFERTLQFLSLVTDDYPATKVLLHQAGESIAKSELPNKSQSEEHAALLHWLSDGGFVFLGAQYWFEKNNAVLADKPLGLFRSSDTEVVEKLNEVHLHVQHMVKEGLSMHFAKLSLQSPVHRFAKLDAMFFRLDSDKILVVIGLFTSRSLVQEVSTVPVVREKLKDILQLEGLIPNSYEYKELVSFVDSLPKSFVFTSSIDDLRQVVALIIGIQRRPAIRIARTIAPLKLHASLLVVMPRNRFTGGVRFKIQSYVEEQCGLPANSAEYRLAVSDDPMVTLYFLLPNQNHKAETLSIHDLEKDIRELTLTWDDRLHDVLLDEFESTNAHALSTAYARTFPEQYKAAVSPTQALKDIRSLELLSPEHPLEVTLCQAVNSQGEKIENHYALKLFKLGHSFSLSAILPFLENMGLRIHNETMTPLATRGTLFAAICNLHVSTKTESAINLKKAEEFFLPGIKLIFEGKAENDSLNSLLLEPGLSCRQVALIRTLVHYLWQLRHFQSEFAVFQAINSAPQSAALLVEFFEAKFNPDPSITEAKRQEEMGRLKTAFLASLKSVSRLLYDQILRALLSIVQATVRTNYFQGEDFRIALKIRCREIEIMPRPRPYFEIFVNAPDFEGVHLRGGKIARGGIRWSERFEDYRTEVLGLMKTQMVKNSVIVPVGGKGGFIVKQQPEDPAILREAVERSYSRFVESLLLITDNRIEDEIIPPKNVVCFDETDPYLVVAADKGTATFSDVANKIAVDSFSFWLGDAFASGGSNGYDHKKFGITAKGTWEAVQRHFRELGLDPTQQDFTMTGIGDMSGDVFGNGLLLSDRAKLIGAFNHKHIFLDPNPDPLHSYQERLRLFALPRSQWSDYRKEIISQGGGIYSRDEKEIHISSEVQKVLAISNEVLSGQELVKAILKAPVDLLWNGGIGTYVKAHDEDNGKVGDRANDEVRIDARELRAKIFAEGGNLGVTQLGRIEYAKIGGNINTDAVDNSGGVDLSDCEVNLKILLQAPLRRKEITLEERNEILVKCSGFASDKVISRNRKQSLQLSLEVRRSRKSLDYYKGLINFLESSGRLDRVGERLPDDENLEKRALRKAGLTRPELAVLGSYAKMSIYQDLLNSSVWEEPYAQNYLKSYFPPMLVEKFPNDIAEHPLKREIIATQIANEIVETMGATFVYHSTEESGATTERVVLAFLAASAILESQAMITQARLLDTATTSRLYLNSLLKISNAVDAGTRWILERLGKDASLSTIISRFHTPFNVLVNQTGTLLTDLEQVHYFERKNEMVQEGASDSLAKSLSALPYTTAFLDSVIISSRTGENAMGVATLYSHLAAALNLGRLLDQAAEIESETRWDALALRVVSAELRDNLARLTESVITQEKSTEKEALDSYLEERKEVLQRFRSGVQEFSNRAITLPALMVLSNQLYALSRGVGE